MAASQPSKRERQFTAHQEMGEPQQFQPDRHDDDLEKTVRSSCMQLFEVKTELTQMKDRIGCLTDNIDQCLTVMKKNPVVARQLDAMHGEYQRRKASTVNMARKGNDVHSLLGTRDGNEWNENDSFEFEKAANKEQDYTAVVDGSQCKTSDKPGRHDTVGDTGFMEPSTFSTLQTTTHQPQTLSICPVQEGQNLTGSTTLAVDDVPKHGAGLEAAGVGEEPDDTLDMKACSLVDVLGNSQDVERDNDGSQSEERETLPQSTNQADSECSDKNDVPPHSFFAQQEFAQLEPQKNSDITGNLPTSKSTDDKRVEASVRRKQKPAESKPTNVCLNDVVVPKSARKCDSTTSDITSCDTCNVSRSLPFLLGRPEHSTACPLSWQPPQVLAAAAQGSSSACSPVCENLLSQHQIGSAGQKRRAVPMAIKFPPMNNTKNRESVKELRTVAENIASSDTFIKSEVNHVARIDAVIERKDELFQSDDNVLGQESEDDTLCESCDSQQSSDSTDETLTNGRLKGATCSRLNNETCLPVLHEQLRTNIELLKDSDQQHGNQNLKEGARNIILPELSPQTRKAVDTENLLQKVEESDLKDNHLYFNGLPASPDTSAYRPSEMTEHTAVQPVVESSAQENGLSHVNHTAELLEDTGEKQPGLQSSKVIASTKPAVMTQLPAFHPKFFYYGRKSQTPVCTVKSTQPQSEAVSIVKKPSDDVEEEPKVTADGTTCTSQNGNQLLKRYQGVRVKVYFSKECIVTVACLRPFDRIGDVYRIVKQKVYECTGYSQFSLISSQNGQYLDGGSYIGSSDINAFVLPQPNVMVIH
ncbi:uncharacterized protein LOC144433881 [Glandiceps talaboti]